jgi:hypothetical protein
MNYNNKSKYLLIFLLLNIPLLLVFNFSLAATGTAQTEYIPIDMGPKIRSANYPIRSGAETLPSSVYSMGLKTSGEYYSIGDTLTWLILDDYNQDYIPQTFELRGIGTDIEVWVQLDLSYPDQDPRDLPVVTDAQVNEMINEFETNIYPTTTEYFGVPDVHYGDNAAIDPDGTIYYEETTRNVMLVSNIRDESYYDDKYPYFIVGFYSPYFENQFDRNIISIDCYKWETALDYYKATTAHEYQHLIHDDYNPEDDLFMNEGCSMYAEPLCGYPIDWDSINSFLYTPDNSLTEWGDQTGINILADYGQALLWTTYLSDHYGGAATISHFVKQGVPGIQGINEALEYFGYTKTFDEIYIDWTIANLIHTNDFGEGLYNYVSIDLNSENAIQANFHEYKKPWVPPTYGTDFGTTKTDLHQDTGISMLSAYGCDYIKFSGLKSRFNPTLYFDGDDKANVPTWTKLDEDGDGDFEWYSTPSMPEYIVPMYTELVLPNEAQVTLSLETSYIIEEGWDFGFAQISLDNGESWVSLENSYTTYDHVDEAYPDIIAELPGLTGDSSGWVSMDFDLSDYAGQSILLGFRYMTDWGYQDPGWWIDNVAINGDIIDNADDVLNFETPIPPENDFNVFLLEGQLVNEIPVYNRVKRLSLNDFDETGQVSLMDFINEDGFVYLIVSPEKGPADYCFELPKA